LKNVTDKYNLNFIVPENSFKKLKIIMLSNLKNKLNYSISKSTVDTSRLYLKDNSNTSNYEINEIIRENDLLSIKESELSKKASSIKKVKLNKEEILNRISEFILVLEEKNN
jgi:hypothetical protein